MTQLTVQIVHATIQVLLLTLRPAWVTTPLLTLEQANIVAPLMVAVQVQQMNLEMEDVKNVKPREVVIKLTMDRLNHNNAIEFKDINCRVNVTQLG